METQDKRRRIFVPMPIVIAASPSSWASASGFDLGHAGRPGPALRLGGGPVNGWTPTRAPLDAGALLDAILASGRVPDPADSRELPRPPGARPAESSGGTPPAKRQHRHQCAPGQCVDEKT